MEQTDVLVVGGGPGGLACATMLARHGANVVLVDRKPIIGPKVCAGGVTWHGLIRRLPDELIERAFPEQVLFSTHQQAVIREPNPIVATINRSRLGQWMADQAMAAGVRLLPATRCTRVEGSQALLERKGNRPLHLRFSHLVGADGSNSRIRHLLGVPTLLKGIGLNATVPGRFPQMEWHLCPRLFGPGYAWVFPHAHTCSVGAYADQRFFSGASLKTHLLRWGEEQHLKIDPQTIHAGLVNHDYRGVRFAGGFLVGDAAGLASGLTGEGIYPALVSGEEVARMILDPVHPGDELARLVKKHRLHNKIAYISGRYPSLGSALMEVLLLLLRWKMIDFRTLEMAE